MLYDLPPERRPKQRGARRKYGQKLGSAVDLATQFRHLAKCYRVHLYGKSREVLAYEQVVMLKTLKFPVHVVWVYRKTQYNAVGQFELVFKGLESVRSDWTPLAQALQRELYRRIFFEEPWEHYIADTVDQVRSGKLDEQLVYRKRLRQLLEAYRRNVPPHVQAARKVQNPGRWINYFITVNGPEPVSKQLSPLD